MAKRKKQQDPTPSVERVDLTPEQEVILSRRYAQLESMVREAQAARESLAAMVALVAGEGATLRMEGEQVVVERSDA